MIAYLDASAIMGIILDEPADPAPHRTAESLVSSCVAEVETFRTLDRVRFAGRVTDIEAARKNSELTHLLRDLHLLPVSPLIIALARGTFPVPVRALDALHVASAQWLREETGEDLEFWTHDRRQATAALCRALDVRGVEV